MSIQKRLSIQRKQGLTMNLKLTWFLVLLSLLTVSVAHGRGQIDPHVSDLIKNLKHPEAAVRSEAAQSLAQMGPKAKPALRALLGALKDQDEDVRAKARGALGKIGPSIVIVLTDLLGDSDWKVRLGAASALGDIGPEARASVPALARAITDPNVSVRW